jgi:hypothetical protein
MLGKLAELLRREGRLSNRLIAKSPDLPSKSLYLKRFGSLWRAYQLVGLGCEQSRLSNEALHIVFSRLVSEIVAAVTKASASVRQDDPRGLIVVNEELTLSIAIARCFRTRSGLRWRIPRRADRGADVTILARMAESNAAVRDYYFLPRCGGVLPTGSMPEHNGVELDSFRYDRLSQCAELCERQVLDDARQTFAQEDLPLEFLPSDQVAIRSWPPPDKKRSTNSAQKGKRRPKQGATALALRAHRRAIEHQIRIISRAKSIRSRLALTVNALRVLYADERFTTLLHAEGFDSIPTPLARVMRRGAFDA